MDYKEELKQRIEHIDTTSLGYDRIKRNLQLQNDEPVEFFIKCIRENSSLVRKEGKNYYVYIRDIIITINSSTLNVITAHKL